MNNTKLEELEVSYSRGQRKFKGIFTLTENYLTFQPFNNEHEKVKEAVYRIVQTGFRKVLQFIPYKFYVKTMSGRVLYFHTLKAKKVAKTIENLIY